MIILKPENGFVVPVVYINNDILFSKKLEIINFKKKSKDINVENKEGNSHSSFRDDNSEVNNEEVIRDRLLLDDYEEEENNNVIAAIVDKNSNFNETGRGILVFDDESNIEIDENKSIELEQVRNNFRKAIEVEIEKVGKLVLDDELNIESKITLNSSESDFNIDKNHDSQKNILTNEIRENNIKECEDNPNIEK